MTLGELARLASAHGLYLAVQPGHPSITIGGCVAADAHGKNHFRDGTFLSQIRSLRLFHPSAGILQLGPNENPDLFRLTCGGYGLTGNIQSVTLQLQPIRSGLVRVTTRLLEEIGRLPELLAEVAQSADLVYTWHDFTCTDDRFGRGMLTAGVFADDLVAGPSDARIPPTRAIRSEMRGRFHARFFNRWTTPVFNRLYRRAAIRRPGPRLVPLYDFCFPVHDKQIYFELFGRAGFHEFQHLVPTGRWPEYLAAIKTRLANHPLPVTLASAKLFRGEQDLLRFTGDGVCMAINVPRMKGSMDFAAFLDDLLPNLGAIPNIIKDSRLPQAAVARLFAIRIVSSAAAHFSIRNACIARNCRGGCNYEHARHRRLGRPRQETDGIAGPRRARSDSRRFRRARSKRHRIRPPAPVRSSRGNGQQPARAGAGLAEPDRPNRFPMEFDRRSVLSHRLIRRGRSRTARRRQVVRHRGSELLRADAHHLAFSADDDAA